MQKNYWTGLDWKSVERCFNLNLNKAILIELVEQVCLFCFKNHGLVGSIIILLLLPMMVFS